MYLPYNVMTFGGKGGVGKTMGQRCSIPVLEDAGRTPRKIIDTDSRSKLFNIYRSTGTAAERRRPPLDGTAEERSEYWSGIYSEMLGAGGIILDLGAGLDTSAVSAMKEMDLGAELVACEKELLCSVVITSDEDSVNTVHKYLTTLPKVVGPNGRIMVIENQMNGRVEKRYPKEWAMLLEAAEAGEIALLTLPEFKYKQIISSDLPDFGRLFKMCNEKHIEEIMQAIGADERTMARSFANAFNDWFTGFAVQLQYTGITSGSLSEMRMGLAEAALEETDLF